MEIKLFQIQVLGQTLLELIAVVGVIGLVVVSLVTGLTISLKNIQYVKEKSLASEYVQEAAEWLTYQRDDSWSNLENNLGVHCINTLPSSSPWSTGECASGDYIPDSEINFQREVTLTASDPNQEVQAEIKVTWSSPRGTEEVVIDKTLTNWR